MTANTYLNLALERTEPGLWVSRMVLFSAIKPPQIIREISLHRGFNIVWGVDEDDGDNQAVVAGHGVGKTSFCRLLRYCLGEATFGTKNSREQIRLAFPQGYVAAEVHVHGEQWAVARPIGNSKFSYAAKDISIDTLLENRPGINSYHEEFKKVLEDAILNSLVVGMIGGSKQRISWEHLLAWCTRDQEARFQSIWQWRSPRSESEMPAFDKPRVDALFVMRTVLGLLTGQEASLTEDLARLDKEIAKTIENIAERQKEPEYWCRHYNKKLKEMLKIDAAEDISLESDGLFGLPNIVKNEQAQLTKETSGIENKIGKLDIQSSDISQKILTCGKKLNVLIATLDETQAKLDEIKTGVAQKQKKRRNYTIEYCEPGEVFMKECSYVLNLLNLSFLPDVTDIKYAGKISTQLEERIPAIEENIAQLKTTLANLRHEQQVLSGERIKLQWQSESSRRCKDEVGITFEELKSWTDLLKGKKPDTILFDLQQKLDSLNKNKEDRQAQLNNLLKEHEAHLNGLRKIFDGVIKDTLSDDFRGVVTFVHGELEFKITHGNTLAGEAIETLTILLADVSALILGMCGRGYHPSFLVHDSPREADLGARIYSRFLRFMANLHNRCGGTDQAPFQYIVTTTTMPPPELQSAKFVQLKLDTRMEENMLFCKNIGTISIGDYNYQQLPL